MTERRLIYRYRLWVPVTHWINVICMTLLLMSGLHIFNAHPALIGATPHISTIRCW